MKTIIEYLVYTTVTVTKNLIAFLFVFLIIWFGVGGVISVFFITPLFFDGKSLNESLNELFSSQHNPIGWLFIVWYICGIYVIISASVISFKKHKSVPTPLYNKVYSFFA